MTKRTAKETADNEGVDRRNERIYREMYRKEMKARRSEERRDNDGRGREKKRAMAERYFKKTDLSIHQRTIKLIARRHASVGDRPRFSMPSATKLCPPLSLFSSRVSALLFHGRFKLFPEKEKKMYPFSFPFAELIYRAIIRARSTERNIAERRTNTVAGRCFN